MKLAADPDRARVRTQGPGRSQRGCGEHSGATVHRRPAPIPIRGCGCRRSSALGRLGKVEAAEGLVARTADDDPLVAHVAVKALVALNAVPGLSGGARSGDPEACTRGSPCALQAMHDPQAVDGLIAKLASSTGQPPPAASRSRPCAGSITARPSTPATGGRRGPIPADRITSRSPGSRPRKIERALGDALKRADSHCGRRTLGRAGAEQGRARGRGGLSTSTWRPSSHPRRAVVVDILVARRSLPERASHFLEELALSDKESPALRAKVLAGLIRHQRRSATRVLAAIGQQDRLPAAVLDVWRDYLRDDSHAAASRRIPSGSPKTKIRRSASWAMPYCSLSKPIRRRRRRPNPRRSGRSSPAWNTPTRRRQLVAGDRPYRRDELRLSGPESLEG